MTVAGFYFAGVVRFIIIIYGGAILVVSVGALLVGGFALIFHS